MTVGVAKRDSCHPKSLESSAAPISHQEVVIGIVSGDGHTQTRSIVGITREQLLQSPHPNLLPQDSSIVLLNKGD